MQPGKYTELFFLDEATALAAGHRPCALCRREDYVRFCGAWRRLHGEPTGADAIDARLHAERVDPGTRARCLHRAALDGLPDGAFVVEDGEAWLVLGSRLRRWTPAGYSEGRPRRAKAVSLLTPPSIVDVLRSGWDPVVPFLHPTARA
jgi:hypothetical protein